MNRNKITQALVKELFDYDFGSGQLIRRKSISKNTKKGDVVGSLSALGYLVTSVSYKTYGVHALIWLWVTGELPENVDHINHNTIDNRIENLRNVSKQENNRNRKRPKTNTSGVMGVAWHKGSKRWVAYISVDDKRLYLGYFAEFHKAVDARKNAEVLYGYHKNSGKDYV